MCASSLFLKVDIISYFSGSHTQTGHQWEASKPRAAALTKMKWFREAILEAICFGHQRCGLSSPAGAAALGSHWQR